MVEISRDQELRFIRDLDELGHLRHSPDNPAGLALPPDTSLDALTFRDEAVKGALHSRALFQADIYTEAVWRHHGRLPHWDRELGPAALELLNTQRCWVPDFEPVIEHGQGEAGVGNWKGCHDVGDFHSAAVRVDRRGIGSHLRPHFKTVLEHVQNAFSAKGMLWHFVDAETNQNLLTGAEWEANFQIDFTFVQRSSGWIGLAIVGQNQTCASRIWCRYLATYSPRDIVNMWFVLIAHELGHNCGSGHERGGIMNATIRSGLPTGVIGETDAFHRFVVREFGGRPVDDRPPPPDETLEERVKRVENFVLQLIVDQSLQEQRIRRLEERGQ